MNAVELIKQDHREVEKLLAHFLETDSENTQEDLYQRIQAALTAHAEMEERVFYPVVKQFAPEQVEEALREHAEVKQTLAELLDADLNEEDFETRFLKLMDEVKHHVEEEESPKGILAVAQQNLDEESLSELSRQILNIRHQIEEDLAA
jgi:hemerythrin superfamily protein